MNPSPCKGRFYSREYHRNLTPGNQVFFENLRDKKIRLKTSKIYKKARTSADQYKNLHSNVATLISAVDNLQVVATEPKSAEGTNSTNSTLKIIETRQKKD